METMLVQRFNYFPLSLSLCS